MIHGWWPMWLRRLLPHCTYSELNRRANQLAHYLRRLGVGPEVLVGLCVDRSLDLVIGLLGILKAGGGFVPMDPAYPADRLRFMLEETRASVVPPPGVLWAFACHAMRLVNVR